MVAQMPKFGKKKSYTDWLYTKPVVLFLAALIIFMGVAVFGRFGVEREMYARRIAAEEELTKAEARKADLEEEVLYLEGERGIEEEIRKHFDVAREGETVVILTGEEVPEEGHNIPEPEPPKRWYQFWR